jgi:hypothetical protein
VSPGLCAIVVGDINEAGMSWTRNGVNQGRAFEVEVDGDTGHATLTITGSFTSAGCANGHACGM